MNILSQVVQRTRAAINRRRFERELAAILKTPPVVLGKDAFTALSMVHHRDVESYLLAIKSFCRFMHPRRIVMVADPSITDADRSRIASHVIGIEIVRAEDYQEPGVPQGGTWERLMAIAEYSQSDYVIQIDADTVTLSEMAEVKKAIAEATSFALATEDGQQLVSCVEAARWAKARADSGEHIQILAEASLDRLPGSESARYVRGCSGFSGFAQGSFSRAQLKAFSQTMGGILGERWAAWGTEQFSSNFMVSNSPRACVLPHPKYCHPGRERAGTVFLHFIGYVRFTTGRYARAARETCAALGAT
jgi:hypothetical protein